jgi:hypothetical protein
MRGTIAAFRVERDGGLTLIQTVQAHAAAPATATPLGLAAG